MAKVSSFLVTAVLPATVALAACGSSQPPASPAGHAPGALAGTVHTAPQNTDGLLAEPTGRKLMSLKRIGWAYGTNDLLKYGSDGSVVIIQQYGGGGARVRRCMLKPAAFAQLRADLKRLPLGRPIHTKTPKRVTFYTPTPPQYTLQDGKRIESFTGDAMPADARPFVRLLQRTMSDDDASCRETFRTRSA
jgi:hypothetical protein